MFNLPLELSINSAKIDLNNYGNKTALYKNRKMVTINNLDESLNNIQIDKKLFKNLN